MKPVDFEKFAEAQKSASELFAQVVNKALNGVERVTRINLENGRNLLNIAGENTKQLMAAKNVSDAASTSSQQLKPQVDQLVNYSHELYAAISELQKDITNTIETQVKTLTESSLSELQGQNIPGADVLSKSIKSMIDASHKSLENMSAATKHFSEVAEQNFKTIVRTAEAGDQSAKKEG